MKTFGLFAYQEVLLQQRFLRGTFNEKKYFYIEKHPLRIHFKIKYAFGYFEVY